MALKAELLEKTICKSESESSRRVNLDSSYSTSDKGKATEAVSQSQTRSSGMQIKDSSGSTTKQTAAATSREEPKNPNPYARATPNKCYRCGKEGHRSNECPDRKPVNLVEPEVFLI